MSRRTPARRMASSTLLVRKVPSQKSTDGSAIAFAMSGLAAKWKTWLTPSIAAVSGVEVLQVAGRQPHAAVVERVAQVLGAVPR